MCNQILILNVVVRRTQASAGVSVASNTDTSTAFNALLQCLARGSTAEQCMLQ